jgi:hypothetical protein
LEGKPVRQRGPRTRHRHIYCTVSCNKRHCIRNEPCMSGGMKEALW